MSVWYSIPERFGHKRFEVANVDIGDDPKAVAAACAAAEYRENGYPPGVDVMTFVVHATAKGRAKYRYRVAVKLVPVFAVEDIQAP